MGKQKRSAKGEFIIDKKLVTLIQRLERDLLQGESRKSVKKLNELIADDFFEIGQSGIWYAKQDVMNIVPRLAGVRYIMHKFQAKQIDSNTILVTFEASKEIVENHQRTRSVRTSIWQKRNQGWQIIFHQGTPIA